MRPFRIVLVAVVGAGVAWGIVACARHWTPRHQTRLEQSAQAAPQIETPPLIGTLRSRSRTFYLYEGRVTVEAANGQVLAHLVTKEELAKSNPILFDEFQQMFALGPLLADNLTGRGLPPGSYYSAQPTQTLIVPNP